MTHSYVAIFILFFVFDLFIGLFLIIKPELAIEMQKIFYAQINWRIEPISMQKEIRNTRIMGWFLLFVSLVTLFFVFTRKLSF